MWISFVRHCNIQHLETLSMQYTKLWFRNICFLRKYSLHLINEYMGTILSTQHTNLYQTVSFYISKYFIMLYSENGKLFVLLSSFYYSIKVNVHIENCLHARLFSVKRQNVVGTMLEDLWPMDNYNQFFFSRWSYYIFFLFRNLTQNMIKC